MKIESTRKYLMLNDTRNAKIFDEQTNCIKFSMFTRSTISVNQISLSDFADLGFINQNMDLLYQILCLSQVMMKTLIFLMRTKNLYSV